MTARQTSALSPSPWMSISDSRAVPRRVSTEYRIPPCSMEVRWVLPPAVRLDAGGLADAGVAPKRGKALVDFCAAVVDEVDHLPDCGGRAMQGGTLVSTEIHLEHLDHA